MRKYHKVLLVIAGYEVLAYVANTYLSLGFAFPLDGISYVLGSKTVQGITGGVGS